MCQSWRSRGTLFALLLVFAAGARPAAARSLEDLLDGAEGAWLERWEHDGRGEEEEELETDRDSFTFATTTVSRGKILLEAAHSYIDNRAGVDAHSFPEFLGRVGVTDRLEARFGANYEVGGGGDVTGADATGDSETPQSVEESKVIYGLKYALTKQEEWLPASAVILQGSTPTSGPENASTLIVGYAFGWKVFKEWKLDAAIRYANTKEEDNRFSEWAPSVVLKVPVGEKWNAHIEYFGIFSDGKTNETNGQYVSPGIHYLLTPNFEIGVRVGWGLNNDAANFFSNVGLGLMF